MRKLNKMFTRNGIQCNMNQVEMTIRANTDTYRIEDHDCDSMMFSKTYLHTGKETQGHSHNHSEIYHIVSGRGRMVISDNVYQLRSGLVFLVPGMAFHKVWNESQVDLEFICFWVKPTPIECGINSTITDLES